MTRGAPMHPDRHNPTGRPPIDDAALAALVRDVADDWHLPPQRLDAVTWRDRAGRGYRAGGGGAGVRWTGRLFGAAAVAVVATVSLWFAAVWLTAPPSDRGSASASGSPSPTPGASGTGPLTSTVPAPSRPARARPQWRPADAGQGHDPDGGKLPRRRPRDRHAWAGEPPVEHRPGDRARSTRWRLGLHL